MPGAPSTAIVEWEEDGRIVGLQAKITPLFRSAPIGASLVHLRRRLDKWVGLTVLPGHRVATHAHAYAAWGPDSVVDPP